MLFAAKNHLGWTFLAIAALITAAVAFHTIAGLPWKWAASTLAWQVGAIGAVAIAASDGVGHFLLRACFGQSYLHRYRALVEYCRPQRAWHIVASGLLAATEEVFFRGTLQEWLTVQRIPAAAAVIFVAVLFAAANAIPRRNFWPFWLWADWEGVLLGCIYAYSGSLLVTAIVHCLHDIAGFTLFAEQRRTGWLL